MRSDDESARNAIADGAQLPKPKADKVRAELEQAEHELELVSDVLPKSANEVLAAAQPIAATPTTEATRNEP
jgi:hypothetical protein